MALAEERCEVCRPGTPHLSADDALELAAELDGVWEVEGYERLRRTVRTSDFAEALSLAVRIGLLAETQGHHPDLSVGWGRLGIALTTHAAEGLTRSDFVLAAKIDRLLSRKAEP